MKKKQNLLKNKEDSKRILDELIKKSVNRMFWEDLERPLPKYYFDANEQAYLNFDCTTGWLHFRRAFGIQE